MPYQVKSPQINYPKFQISLYDYILDKMKSEHGTPMKTVTDIIMLPVIFAVSAGICFASDFGTAENALGKFKSIKYRKIFTKVPSPGKLVSIKITDSGKAYYICKEKSGFVIYHTEIRPLARFRTTIEKEVHKLTGNWDKINPNELLFTQDRYYDELNNRLYKYSDVVWVRNEILVEPPASSRPIASER